jgi:putative transposase
MCTCLSSPKPTRRWQLALKQAHGRYASYWNIRHGSCGHVWQGRYYSCPLGQRHVWAALRYAELNPVRAGLVTRAEDWPWSSTAAHYGTAAAADPLLSMDWWRRTWDGASWRQYLAEGDSHAEVRAIRRFTHTGRPLGDAGFVEELEELTQRHLRVTRGGQHVDQGANHPDQL